MLTKQDYERALNIQDACNLSGVVRSWARVMERIWDEAHAKGKGTEFVNRHEINVLYASKVASLTNAGGMDEFSMSYDLCKQAIEDLSDDKS